MTTWKPVRGYEGFYEVSDRGRVKRVGRCIGATPGRVLRLYKEKHGYMAVCLQKNDIRHRFRVHRLVYEAFVGPIPEGLTINHIDGDKVNNQPSNLEVMTRGENVRHAIRIGLFCQDGEANHSSKLTEGMVRRIRETYIPGVFGQIRTAKHFGLNPGTVRDVLTRKTWRSVA